MLEPYQYSAINLLTKYGFNKVGKYYYQLYNLHLEFIFSAIRSSSIKLSFSTKFESTSPRYFSTIFKKDIDYGLEVILHIIPFYLGGASFFEGDIPVMRLVGNSISIQYGVFGYTILQKGNEIKPTYLPTYWQNYLIWARNNYLNIYFSKIRNKNKIPILE